MQYHQLIHLQKKTSNKFLLRHKLFDVLDNRKTVYQLMRSPVVHTLLYPMYGHFHLMEARYGVAPHPLLQHQGINARLLEMHRFLEIVGNRALRTGAVAKCRTLGIKQVERLNIHDAVSVGKSGGQAHIQVLIGKICLMRKSQCQVVSGSSVPDLELKTNGILNNPCNIREGMFPLKFIAGTAGG